nr:hypothetical protein HK105_007112 [Polyrhizophydium stewartii]
MRHHAALLLLQAVAATDIGLRGVNPADVARFRPAGSSDSFVCFDRSATISFASVNDDFCDCADGSDEPDPECCDGSDEYASGAKCVNTCAAAAAAFKKQRDEAEALLREGGRRKKQLIERARSQGAGRKDEIDMLDLKITALEARLDYYNEAKAKAAEYEKRAKAASGKSGRCSERLAELHEIRQSLRSAASSLQGKYNALASAIRDIDLPAEGPVDAGQVRAAHAVLDSNSLTLDESRNFYADDYSDAPDEEDDGVVAKKDPCNEDDAPFVACVFYSLYDVGAYFVHGAMAPFYWDGWGKLARMFHEWNDPEALLQNPQKAQELAAKVEGELSVARDRLKDLKELDSKDMGPAREWETLFKKCFQFQDPEYKYEMCLFDSIKQTPKSGFGDVSLGSFSRWGNRAGSNLAADTKYASMMFENGQGCWNGPARSVEVVFQCGLDTKILTVSEPNKCEYRIEAMSPAVCPTPAEEPAKGSAASEL